MLKTKEQLLYYFTGKNLKLSIYDEKFCQNLQHLITKTNRVTTNQKELFERLISKYKKQLIHLGIDIEDCKCLDWSTNIVESEPKYTGAQVSISQSGDKIIVRVPFNRKFISRLREDMRPNINYLEWVRTEKYYVCPLCTGAIRFLVDELHKYFPTVTFDEALQNLIDTALMYNAEIYNPTLVKINNNFYVAAINSELYESVKDIELNDDPKTLFTLSQYGISIGDDIIQNDRKKLFASTMVVNVDSNDLKEVLQWLYEFEIDKVYFGGRFAISSTIMYSLTKAIEGASYTKKIRKMIRDMEKQLGKLNISYSHSHNFFKENNVAEKRPVVIQFIQGVEPTIYGNGKRICKFIVVRDSSPVDIEVLNEAS